MQDIGFQWTDAFKDAVAAHFSVAILNTDGRIIDANERLAMLFGYTPEKLVVASVAPFEQNTDSSLSFASIRFEVDQAGIWQGDISWQNTHNEPFWLSVTITPHQQPGQYLLVGTTITWMRFSDRQMLLKDVALDNAFDAVVITNADGDAQWVNKAFTSLTGYEFDEVVGKNMRFLKSGKQEEEFYENLWKTIASGEVWRGELWNRRKDGSYYLEEQSITPVADSRGNIQEYIAIKRDFTEQHELRQQLAQAQKMEAVGQLTGGIAHNFNNKLGTILGYSELALEEGEQYDNEDLKDYLGEILEAGKVSAELVNQLLSFSRSEARETEEVDLVSVVGESVKILMSSFPSSMAVNVRFECDKAMMQGDVVKLHQMIMTLGTNARDAMNNTGNMTVGVRLPGRVRSTCASCHNTFDGEYVELYVKDTGKGIRQRDLDRIFIPYFTTRDMASGAGMGLSVLHGLLHDMGGHVAVESVPGEGSVFRLLFPLLETADGVIPADAGVPAEDTEESMTEVNGDGARKKQVLVVDDNRDFAILLRDILEMQDYEVSLELEVTKALEDLRKEPARFDLVLTDMTMFGMTGMQLARAIKELRPDLPVVLMSGHAEALEEEAARADEIDGYLAKPVDMSYLAVMAEKLIKGEKLDEQTGVKVSI